MSWSKCGNQGQPSVGFCTLPYPSVGFREPSVSLPQWRQQRAGTDWPKVWRRLSAAETLNRIEDEDSRFGIGSSTVVPGDEDENDGN